MGSSLPEWERKRDSMLSEILLLIAIVIVVVAIICLPLAVGGVVWWCCGKSIHDSLMNSERKCNE